MGESFRVGLTELLEDDNTYEHISKEACDIDSVSFQDVMWP